MASHAKPDGPAVVPTDRPGPAPATDELPVFRFGLRHLFWFVSLLCVLLAAMVATAGSGVGPLAVLLAVLVIALHVTGTALGTRLRAHADAQVAHAVPITTAGTRAFVPKLRRSLLHERGFLNRWLPTWVAVGAAIGGLAGVGMLAATIGHRATLAGVAVGGISAAVLGAWFAFLAISSWAIAREGWRQSVADHHRDRTDRPG